MYKQTYTETGLDHDILSDLSDNHHDPLGDPVVLDPPSSLRLLFSTSDSMT